MPRSLAPVWISPGVELPADSAVVNVLTADLMIVLRVRYRHPLAWELPSPYTPLARPVLGWQAVRPTPDVPITNDALTTSRL